VLRAVLDAIESDRAGTVTEVNQRARLAFARITPTIAIEPASLTITPIGEVSTTCQSD